MRNGYLILSYPIASTDVHLYKNHFQINSNVFSLFNDDGRARYHLIISRKNNERVVNQLY